MPPADSVPPSPASNPPSSTSRLAEPDPPPKRSCLGCAVMGGLGCLAFVVGGLLVTWLLADRLANGVARRTVEGSFNESYEGELQIGQVNIEPFDWSERQSIEGIRLLDPEGEEVLTAMVELPPVRDFLSVWNNRGSSERVELGLIRVALSGRVVADEEGVTNLDRALESVDQGSSSGSITIETNREEIDPFDLLSRLSMECVLDISELAYSDVQTRELGGEVLIRQFTARAVGRAGGGWRFNLDGDVVAPGEAQEEGKLFAEFNAPEPTWGRSEWPFGVVQGQGSAKELRTAVLDGLTGQNGMVSEVLGDAVDLEFHLVEATPESGRVELISHSSKQDLVFEGLFKEGRLSIDGTEGFVWRIEPPKRLIDEKLAGFMSDEGSLALRDLAPGERLTFELDRLEIPISDVSQVSDSGFSALRSARNARFAGRIEVPTGLIVERPEGALEIGGNGTEPLVRFEQADEGIPHATLWLGVRGEGQSAPDANLTVNVEAAGLWQKLLDPAYAEEKLSGAVDVATRMQLEVLQVANFQRFVPGEEDLASWLGSSGVLELRVPDALEDERTLRGEWVSDVLRADIDLRQSAEWLLRAEPESGPALRLRFLGPQLERRLQETLPSGNNVTLPGAFGDENGALLEVNELQLATSQEGALDKSRSQLLGRFFLPSLRAELADSAAETAGLDDLEFTFSLPELGPLRVDLSAQVADRADASIEAHLMGREPWSGLLESSAAVEEGGEPVSALETATFDLSAEAISLPTALVDALSKGDGLLVDVLGETLQLDVRAAGLGLNAGRLDAQFESGLGEVHWVGRMEDGRLISEGEDMLDASVALTPLFSRRIVGNLVPLLVNVSKDDEISPVTLDVSNCVLPLDGDLKKLSGEVQLNLGEVYYSVLPQFEEWLGDMTRTKATEIAPLSFKIQNGVVAYDKLPIKVEGDIYNFSGTFDLSSRKLGLTTSVPLTNLGSSVSEELARAREKFDLDPNLAIPMEIGGTLTRPKVKLQEGFLAGLAGDLLEQGLERELLKGLNKLLGKD